MGKIYLKSKENTMAPTRQSGKVTDACQKASDTVSIVYKLIFHVCYMVSSCRAAIWCGLNAGRANMRNGLSVGGT